MMRALIVTAVVVIAAACGSPAPSAGTVVGRSTLGAAWPLTIESGTIRCEGAGAIVFTAPDGKEYGVNGLAATYADIAPIWAADPSGLTPKMDISPLIQAGRKLCP